MRATRKEYFPVGIGVILEAMVLKWDVSILLNVEMLWLVAGLPLSGRHTPFPPKWGFRFLIPIIEYSFLKKMTMTLQFYDKDERAYPLTHDKCYSSSSSSVIRPPRTSCPPPLRLRHRHV